MKLDTTYRYELENNIKVLANKETKENTYIYLNPLTYELTNLLDGNQIDLNKYNSDNYKLCNVELNRIDINLLVELLKNYIKATTNNEYKYLLVHRAIMEFNLDLKKVKVFDLETYSKINLVTQNMNEIAKTAFIIKNSDSNNEFDSLRITQLEDKYNLLNKKIQELLTENDSDTIAIINNKNNILYINDYECNEIINNLGEEFGAAVVEVDYNNIIPEDYNPLLKYSNKKDEKSLLNIYFNLVGYIVENNVKLNEYKSY